MEAEKTLNDIRKLVDWWFNLKKGYSDIDNLLEINRKLSGYSYYLGELVAENYTDYLFYYSLRKIGEIKEKQRLIEIEGLSANKAEILSHAKCYEDLKNEIIQEGNYERLRVLLRQTNLIISQIDNRIYRLRKEQENPKNY